MNRKKGFVVSAVLYPLLVIFLALIMGLLSMSDVRKRILDRMKLEISDSLFDEASCSCETILNKLNYIIKNGVGCSGGGGGGGITQIVDGLGLRVTAYETSGNLPQTDNTEGDIAVITTTKVSGYYLSNKAPAEPYEGQVWLVQDVNSEYYVTSGWARIPISYLMQYENEQWNIKRSYVWTEDRWQMLYYLNIEDGIITSEDSNIQVITNFSYTGKYQKFTAVFSGVYRIELWGASGSSDSYSGGGKGAYTAGDIYLDAGKTIYVYVGGTNSGASGGWNGGGNGSGSYRTYGRGYGGGGATDIRLVKTDEETTWNDFESLKSRIMVAAGGGSAGSYYNTGDYYSVGAGGDGGVITGYNGTCSYKVYDYYCVFIGLGGLNASGGYRADSATTYVGGFGYGGSGNVGGGGGYYGGGGASYTGAGGGSSYISGHDGCNSLEEASFGSNIIHNGSAYHYSGYYFTNSVIQRGQNSGAGKARITLKTVEGKTKEQLNDGKKEKVWGYSYSGIDQTNGRYQIFVAPKTGNYQMEAWGANGDGDTYSGGGHGSYTSGQLNLEKGDKLYIYVGGIGAGTVGGWNGGGNGSGSYSTYGLGYGGGGATDIRLEQTSSLTSWDDFESLKSRIMVAAGGGSAGSSYNTGDYYSVGSGGSGGILKGYNGTCSYKIYNYCMFIGLGAEQGTPGYRYDSKTTYVGGFGYGGSGNAGGGGGYYGGGGASHTGAGGGSSYVSGYSGCDSLDESATASTMLFNGSPYHSSGYYFKNAEIMDGNNSNIPNPTGEDLKKVNTGSGYFRIKFLKEAELIDKSETEQLNEEWHFSYSGARIDTGRYQIFKANKTGFYSIELWGAQGGTDTYSGGGLGAYTYGEIKLNVGEKLYVYVGGYGGAGGAGGWNGGGNGSGSYSTYGLGYGGGGATDVRLTPTTTILSYAEQSSLKSRIMVAAGGGSAGSYYPGADNYSYGAGGAGGGLKGYKGTGSCKLYSHCSYIGTGALQIKGGYRNDSVTTYVAGYGTGGDGGSGGGGGYYGGGGSLYVGAGGGSSYISGHAGCIATDSNGHSTLTEYNELEDSIHYKGYKFTNTIMIDGQGYEWNPEKSANIIKMPTAAGTGTQVGQSGNGHAKITYLGA